MNQEQYTYNPVKKCDDAIPLWFCFPCEYTIGMSSLGFLSLFSLLDKNANVFPERIFTDTLKTVHKAQDVKFFGFSYSFELDFINIFKVLEKYNIPLYSKDRYDSTPLIFGGGPVLSANPEPFADIFDFIILGDGEDVLTELIEKYKQHNHLSKQELLVKLSEINGLYVPSFFQTEYSAENIIKSRKCIANVPEQISKRCANLSSCMYSPIITPDTMFSDTFLVEITRGCPYVCNFCLASYSNLPTRYPSKESIIQAIDKGLEYTDKIGLLGALISAHPDFEEICEHISGLNNTKPLKVSVSSLRADKITPQIIKMLVASGQKSSTIAIESGSQRLRDFINKNLNEEQIFESVKIASEYGLSALKIYAMIGLPTETIEDITKLADLLKKLKTDNKKINLTLSVSSFVPKAQTPFQWYGRENAKTLEKKNNFLKKELHKAGINFRPTSVKWDNIQGIVSRGDRRLSPVLEKVYRFGSTIGSFARAHKETLGQNESIPTLDWYSNRQIPFEEALPWDFINSYTNKEKLFKAGNYRHCE